MNNIRFWRLERGLSQFDLVQASGVPRYAIQLFEMGHKQPTADQVLAIAEAMGVEVRDLARAPKSQAKRTMHESKGE